MTSSFSGSSGPFVPIAPNPSASDPNIQGIHDGRILPPKKQRKLSARKCDNCRKAKQKCHDEGSGCRRCSERGFACPGVTGRKPRGRAAVSALASGPAVYQIEAPHGDQPGTVDRRLHEESPRPGPDPAPKAYHLTLIDIGGLVRCRSILKDDSTPEMTTSRSLVFSALLWPKQDLRVSFGSSELLHDLSSVLRTDLGKTNELFDGSLLLSNYLTFQQHLDTLKRCGIVFSQKRNLILEWELLLEGFLSRLAAFGSGELSSQGTKDTLISQSNIQFKSLRSAFVNILSHDFCLSSFFFFSVSELVCLSEDVERSHTLFCLDCLMISLGGFRINAQKRWKIRSRQLQDPKDIREAREFAMVLISQRVQELQGIGILQDFKALHEWQKLEDFERKSRRWLLRLQKEMAMSAFALQCHKETSM
ncbi:hypothetical protein F5Y15DRAFT_378317 [Xylariaceae sp. FL0016]|nr:hypothetical protein F5Y15DRAFT_378317 [Xylariaceae sp. FL0016]